MCPGTWCPPSPRLGNRSPYTAIRWHLPTTPCHLRNVGIESLPATATGRGTGGISPQSRNGPRIPAAFAGSLPFGDHTTPSGYLSQVHTQYRSFHFLDVHPRFRLCLLCAVFRRSKRSTSRGTPRTVYWTKSDCSFMPIGYHGDLETLIAA